MWAINSNLLTLYFIVTPILLVRDVFTVAGKFRCHHKSEIFLNRVLDLFVDNYIFC
jgi:hypothetical protein